MTFIYAWVFFLIGLLIAWLIWGNNSSDNA
jgi:hypothetical protein